jgi:signal transduction histidine kinase
LGLALSAWIVRAHGGEITVNSREGVGSVFTVALPVAPPL